MAGHSWGKRLCKRNSLHNTILDSHDKPLLLLGASAYSDRGQELPDVDIFTSIDSAGEDGGEGGLQDVEERIISVDPYFQLVHILA